MTNEALDKQFTVRLSHAQAPSQLMSLKQKPNRSPTEFAREIEAAGRTYFIGVPENFI